MILPGLPVLLLFIYSQTSIELTPIFLPLLKMTEVIQNVDIIFLQIVLQIFYTLFYKLPPCCWHFRLQY